MSLAQEGLCERARMDDSPWRPWVLQRFIFPGSPENLALYAHVESGELLYRDRKLRTTAGSSLSFNAYLNCFYEAYWVHYTNVERVSLVVFGQGSAWCSIFRDAPVTGVEMVARERIDLDLFGQASLAVELRQPSHGNPGRLFLALETEQTGLVVERICWATTSPPVREVSLGVGICTFNRQQFVANTVERLIAAGPEACIDRVVVVNQGEPISSEKLEKLKSLEPGRLRVLDQDNFGGAGGFARSAIELLKTSTITHVLFMDDDIELNCGHVATAAAFLSYSRSQMVVGGQMLDLFDRCLMSEAGGQVSGLNIVKPNHEQLHLLDQESLRAIGRLSLTHYNGWWFAAIPADAFRAHGMPLPIFIRGDDMEFGIRLRRAGVPTVSLPPISVWHEPFYATPPGWKHYYDLRNRLIFASIYPEHCRLDSALRLFKILLAMIVRYDYQYIEIIRQALADFLEGPRVLRAQAEKHATVLRLLQRCVPEVLEYGAELPAASAAPAGRAAGRVRLLISLVRALGGWPARDLAGRECAVDPQALRHRMRLGRSYVLADPGGRYYLRFRYSLRRSWGGLARTVPMILRYRLRRGATAARWKAAFPDLVGQENWERRLGLRPEVEPLHERPQAAEDRQRKWSPRPAVRTSPPIGRSTM